MKTKRLHDSRRSQRFDEERGITQLGMLFLVVIIGAIVFAGSQIFPFFYSYYELEGLMESQAAKAQIFTDAEIRQNILENIEKSGIPYEQSDADKLKINRFDGKIAIDFEYTEVLYIDLGSFYKGFGNDHVYNLYVFPFHPHAEHVIPAAR